MESKYCDRPRECENTAMKMAQKRAFVGATLIAAGLSDEFTQDIEDFGGANMGGDAPNNAGNVAGGSTGGSTGAATAFVQAQCPKCRGAMYDNRRSKKNPRQPDFKCKDPKCGGVFWPPKVVAGEGGRQRIDWPDGYPEAAKPEERERIIAAHQKPAAEGNAPAPRGSQTRATAEPAPREDAARADFTANADDGRVLDTAALDDGEVDDDEDDLPF